MLRFWWGSFGFIISLRSFCCLLWLTRTSSHSHTQLFLRSHSIILKGKVQQMHKLLLLTSESQTLKLRFQNMSDWEVESPALFCSSLRVLLPESWMLVGIYNPSIPDVETGGSWTWGQLGLQSESKPELHSMTLKNPPKIKMIRYWERDCMYAVYLVIFGLPYSHILLSRT